MANSKQSKDAANLIFFIVSFIVEIVVLICSYFKGICDE